MEPKGEFKTEILLILDRKVIHQIGKGAREVCWSQLGYVGVGESLEGSISIFVLILKYTKVNAIPRGRGM